MTSISNTFKYQFAPYKRGSKITCPKCHKKGHWTRYIDVTTGEYLPDEFGICDSTKCGHFNPPKDVETVDYNNIVIPDKSKEPFNTIPKDIFLLSFKDVGKDNFTQWLLKNFPKQNVEKAIKNYKIGTAKKFGGKSTVFWQIDKYGKVRSGKIMKYSKKTGKRIKEPITCIDWVHTSFKDYNLRQCFFGEHLLKKYPNREVIIVESEKSAVILAIVFGYDKLFLSCGQLRGLAEDKFKVLRGRKVTLIPDKGEEFELVWKNYQRSLQKQGFDVSLYSISQYTELEDGDDVADLILKSI